MNKIIPLEHDEQVAFVSWFKVVFRGVLIAAIPNGGYRTKRGSKRLKDEGVCPGIPDLFIPEWRLFIEMKRQKNSYLSPDQKKVIKDLQLFGYTVIVGHGFEDASQKVLDFHSSFTS